MKKYEIFYQVAGKMYKKQIIAFDVHEAMFVFKGLMGRVSIKGVHKMRGAA